MKKTRTKKYTGDVEKGGWGRGVLKNKVFGQKSTTYNQMKIPNFVNPSTDSSQKIGHDFSNDEFKNESNQNIVIIKNVPLN